MFFFPVHRINPGLSLTQANFARMQSSYSSSHQERKESSSSSVTKTLGEQSVTSVSESQSSQSQQKSSVSATAGQLSYGDHGQAVFTGIKKEASSESHEKSSSSSQRISSSNGAVTGKCTHTMTKCPGWGYPVMSLGAKRPTLEIDWTDNFSYFFAIFCWFFLVQQRLLCA